MLKIKIIRLYPVLFLSFLSLLDNSHGYTCSTPNEWMGIESDHVSAQNYIPGTKWPKGVVKYHINSSLETEDIKEVYLAFEEYHKKTCIRFEPYQSGDPNYTSIELDNNVCGRGHICMRGGYQYARFGKDCRKMTTVIHELGHNLCLGHEHQRHDRDSYITYDGCKKSDTTQLEKQMGKISRGAYDYYSQMHYECGDCRFGGWPKSDIIKKCGPQINPGLSVFDADYINEMYDCQGCFRHRWIPSEDFGPEHMENLHSINLWNIYNLNISLYICRGSFNGGVKIGTFNLTGNVCTISHDDSNKEQLTRFEIFTVPGGLKDSSSEYYLLKMVEGMPNHPNTNLVVAGYFPPKDEIEPENRLVGAYQLVDLENRCLRDPKANPTTLRNVGSAKFKYAAKFFHNFTICNEKNENSRTYAHLACRNTHLKDFGPNLDEDIYTNWKLKRMLPIDGGLSIGATITIVGYVLPDAQTFFIDLCEQPAGGKIILHFNPRFEWKSRKNVVIGNSLDLEKWGDEKQIFLDQNFPFSKGTTFKLEIHCGKIRFNFTVNGTPIGWYRFRQPLQNAKFVRIHGDVSVIHVQISKIGESNTNKPTTSSSPKIVNGNSKEANATEKETNGGTGSTKLEFYFLHAIILVLVAVVIVGAYFVVKSVLKLASNKPAFTPVPVGDLLS